MASKNFSGILRDPLGTLANNDKYRFTHVSTTGEVIRGSTSYLTIGDDGVYNIDIEYGNVSIESYSELGKRWIAQGTTTINADTTATTLPALLNALVPASDALILQLEALLSDAESAADRAEAAADNLGTAAAADVTTSPTDTTAGRVLKVGDFGLGIDSSSNTGVVIPNIDGFDNPSGMFIVASGTSGTRPDGLVGNAVLTHKIFTPDRQSQVWHTCSGNGDIFIRELPTRAEGWTEWKKVYHSGNTNFNKIIGNVAGRQLGEVTIRNASTLSFFKDISGFTSRPSSVTVTGTYRIVTRNGASVITGIPASSILLESLTSNTRLNLRISGIDTSIMSAGVEYELAADENNTLIQINP